MNNLQTDALANIKLRSDRAKLLRSDAINRTMKSKDDVIQELKVEIAIWRGLTLATSFFIGCWILGDLL